MGKGTVREAAVEAGYSESWCESGHIKDTSMAGTNGSAPLRLKASIIMKNY